MKRDIRCGDLCAASRDGCDGGVDKIGGIQ